MTRSSSRRPSRSRGAGRDRGRASQRRRRRGAARLRARPARGPRGTRVRTAPQGQQGRPATAAGCTPTPRARIRAPTTREPHRARLCGPPHATSRPSGTPLVSTPPARGPTPAARPRFPAARTDRWGATAASIGRDVDDDREPQQGCGDRPQR